MYNFDSLEKSLRTSFLDADIESNEELRSQLIINNYKKGTKVLSHILSNLNTCDEFFFSVAFITSSGLILLINKLKELEKRGVRGKIVTTNYLNFSEPKALKKLLEFSNLEVKVYDKDSFHTKGYIFRKGTHFDAIIGSSNITQDALTKNQEWNLKISSAKNGEITQQILNEFNSLWSESSDLTEDWINNYSEIYKNTRTLNQQITSISTEKYIIKPNLMQSEALSNLSELRINKKDKALLISATGTGKTYLSAFDVQQYNPNRILFIVHREQIAKSALKSFKKIFGNSRTYGIYSGNSKDKTADFIFCTVQTLSKEYYLKEFDKKAFDYIIIDEVHRAGAKSYKQIIDYFEPKFLLGMTATPERSDGFNIYELFDYNIAYEIRLQKALESDMLCPFHYFGVSDIIYGDELMDDKHFFNYLVSEVRADHVIRNAKLYGHSGKRLKGLIFCSRNDEARELSQIFNKKGYHTITLSGSSTQEERDSAVRRLEQDDGIDCLDYIFTVDIFNEGVDIPEVNQIIMLRPTESAIIFVQQLGRGLRKAQFKDYVVVIDFIGNYSNNYLIPIALSGDTSYNADTLRHIVQSGTSLLPGCSTIIFDEISEKQIYKAINQTSFKRLALLKGEYEKLKEKVGHIPTICDFYNLGYIDPQLIFNYSGCYSNFLAKVEPDYHSMLSPKHIQSLTFISTELSNGKRPHELCLIDELLKTNSSTISRVENAISPEYNTDYNRNSIQSAIHILTDSFYKEADRKKYGNISYCKILGDKIIPTNEFRELLNNAEYKAQLEDLLQYSLLVNTKEYGFNSESPFVLYKKYSRKDVCRLLNWNNEESSTMYGYRIKHNTCPIFVTYKKSENISSSTNYNDQFINRSIFSWMTRNNVKLSSTEPVAIRNYKKTGLRIDLFIKKEDGEGTDFYYLGQVDPIRMEETTIMNEKSQNLPIVNVKFRLKDAVREDIYDYFNK